LRNAKNQDEWRIDKSRTPDLHSVYFLALITKGNRRIAPAVLGFVRD
jgi:hypothetical protein